MRETETKLDVHAAFRLPDLSGAVEEATVHELGDALLRSTYWDTADLRLIRAGVTVRHRRGDRTGGSWDVKLPIGRVDGGIDRLELSHPGAPNRPPRPVRDQLALYTRGEKLTPVARLHTRRHTVAVRAGGDDIAEIVDDEVSILDGGRIAARFRELEVETGPAGDDRSRRSIVATLLAEGATVGDQEPKVLRALGPAARRPDDLSVPDEDPGAGIPDDPDDPGAADLGPTDRMRRALVAERLAAVRAADARLRRGVTEAAAPLADALDDLVGALTLLDDTVETGPMVRARDELDAVAGVGVLTDVLQQATEPLEDWLADKVPGRAALHDRLDRALDEHRQAALRLVAGDAYVAAFDAGVAQLSAPGRGADMTALVGELWQRLPTAPADAARLSAALRILSATTDIGGKALRRSDRLMEASRRRRRLDRVASLLQAGLQARTDDAATRIDFAAGAVALHLAEQAAAARAMYADALADLDSKRLAKLRDA